jgi:hypothetical protein
MSFKKHPLHPTGDILRNNVEAQEIIKKKFNKIWKESCVCVRIRVNLNLYIAQFGTNKKKIQMILETDEVHMDLGLSVC